MSKILRTSNRINTRKDLTSNLKTNLKGLKQEEKKEVAISTKVIHQHNSNACSIRKLHK